MTALKNADWDYLGYWLPIFYKNNTTSGDNLLLAAAK
jgi:hypothetical protein